MAPLKGELAAAGRLRGPAKSPLQNCRLVFAAVLNPSVICFANATSPVRGGIRAARANALFPGLSAAQHCFMTRMKNSTA